MPNPYPPYRPEFRAEAVRLHWSSGKSLDRLGRAGGRARAFRSWVKRTEIDEGMRPGLTTEERTEFRRKVRELEKERDIVKKPGQFSFVRVRPPIPRDRDPALDGRLSPPTTTPSPRACSQPSSERARPPAAFAMRQEARAAIF